MSVSVCLSVTEVHWVAVHAEKRGGVISTTTSRAMLATARPSCFIYASGRVAVEPWSLDVMLTRYTVMLSHLQTR